MQPVKKIVWPVVAAVAIATGSYFGSLGLMHSVAVAESPAATAKPTPEPHTEAVAPAKELSLAFRNVHHALKDAVVNIQIVKKEAVQGGRTRMQLPPGFSVPPGFPGFGQGDEGDAPEEEVRGTGSGVIVSADGYILTNNHVVEDATDIEVRLNDGRNLKAKVIGTDPKTDLAVVRIAADHLVYAKFGDSDATEVGDIVLAFGSPLGFEQTMTQGIISAKGRQIGIIAEHNSSLQGLSYEDFLQTDAAINPGNSGGPLVNLDGEVVGINAAIASNTGEYNGIGFSIPSNEARYIMDSLIKTGKVVRGFLGVAIEDINNPTDKDKPLADSIKNGGFSGNGILVNGIDTEGPAGKGGVQSGDVITALNGKPVESVNQLRNQIARTAPGTNVTLSVYRDNKTVELTFPLGTQPATRELAAAEGGDSSDVAGNSLGIQHLRAVNDAEAHKYHLLPGHGVVVTDVDQNGVAAQGGLQPGDVITQVNGIHVSSPDEFNAAISKAKLSDGVRLHVRSADGMDRLLLLSSK
jgi:serine protease Do